MRRVLHFILAAAIVALFTGHADAASRSLCEGFAKSVEKRAAMNGNGPGGNRCGFSSAANYNDPEKQRQWCLASREQTVFDEWNRRLEESDDCAYCRAYSDQANAAAHDNSLFHCGYTGARWGSGGGHFQYCMGQDKTSNGGLINAILGKEIEWPLDSLVGLETRARREGIEQCKKNYTPTQIEKCQVYADEAVKAATFNAGNKMCGNPGGPHTRWSTNWDDHFAFCTWGWNHDIGGQNIVDLMDAETKIRSDDLKKCTLLIKLPEKPTKTLGKKKIGSGQNLAAPGADQNGAPGGKGSPITEIKAGGGVSTVKSNSANNPEPASRRRIGNSAMPAGGGFNTVKGDSSGGVSKVMSPGILESDSGLVRTGPAAAGSPLSGGAPSGGAPPIGKILGSH